MQLGKQVGNRNRNLQASKVPLESQAQGNSLFTSAALNQRVCPKDSPCKAQVWLPEGERRQISLKAGVDQVDKQTQQNRKITDADRRNSTDR